MSLSMFIPITKVDAAQRLVYGLATAEVEDRAGEICDYASTKPLYQKWSNDIAKTTAGKSRGILRAMHGAIAAGKVTKLEFNDAKKQIEICAKVVDDDEWRKVEEGVYTGFSQGGSYARRWTDTDGRARYTASPSEISLVDLPCLPQARFEMIKADGSRELRRFGKGLADVSRLADVVDEVNWLQNSALLEQKDEGDASEVPEQLRELVATACTILRTMVDEETEELLQDGDLPAPRPLVAPSQKAAGSLDDLGKMGARNNAADLERIQHLHDTSVELGATCGGAQKFMGGGFEKRFDALAATLADVLQRVKNIEDQPLPLPLSGQTRAISKGDEDDAEKAMEKLLCDPDKLSLLAIKLAQRNGRPFLNR